MAYESRIYIMRKSEYVPEHAEEIAKIKLANCDFGLFYDRKDFRDLFKTPIDFIFTDEFDNDLSVDKYGDEVKYTDIQTVVNFLEKAEAADPFWRLPPAIAMLKAFGEYNDPNLIVVHYGY